MRAYDNANQGAGGLGARAVVRDSVFVDNGSASFSDFAGPRSSAGLKTVASIRVYNSKFIDNYWNGFWCDVECNATEVHDSVLSRNGKAGLAYEISSGPAVFEGNTIRANGHLDSANRHVGLLIVEASNVEAYGNTFGENVDYGAVFAKGDRHPLDNISFHDNFMNGDRINSGCDLPEAGCYAHHRRPACREAECGLLVARQANILGHEEGQDVRITWPSRRSPGKPFSDGLPRVSCLPPTESSRSTSPWPRSRPRRR